MSSSKVVGMIPSRLQSSRLPEKPLKDICGIPMIVHVLKRCQLAKSLDEVFVVTDSKEIKSVVEEAGGKVIMTGTHHQTGTDRLAEAANLVNCDIVVNIQGDEALVDPAHIDKVTTALIEDNSVNICLLVTPYTKYNSPSDIKVVTRKDDRILYMSRTDLPSNARTTNPEMLKAYHIVPFRKEFLIKYSKWETTKLEKTEFNEYLRILENGHEIKAVHVNSSAISVDTQEDLEYVRKEMLKDPIFQQYT